MAQSAIPVALLTCHHKEQAIGPVLQQFNYHLLTTDQYDTDQLGTFSGEVERTKSPLVCARFKAQKACEISGLNLGLGSEGSFGTGPFGGLVPWNQELLTLVNIAQGWQVTGCAEGPSFQQNQLIENEAQLIEFLTDVPSGQALIMYPESHPANHLHKGLLDPSRIIETYRACAEIHDEPIMVEYDLRAMYCPERMTRIGQAAEDLCKRLNSRCPQCQCPGFWPSKAQPGLPCQLCHLPTKMTAVKIARCQHCDYETHTKVQQGEADPKYCDFCNP